MQTELKSSNPERDQILSQTIDQINRHHGKGAIMRLGEASTALRVDAIPTGALTLDIALGVGGMPRGRVVEVYGPESSGKTTLALAAVARAQALGGCAAFIDVEHALDPTYAQALGVDCENLLVSQPDSGEQALEILEQLARSGALDVIVLDSVAALVPRAEIEGEMGDAHVGLQARLMSQAMRKLTAVLSKTRTCAIFINQIREKVGVMFGSPETTPGGRALKFFASVRLEVRKKETIKQGADPIGSHVQVKVVKNKLAPPFRVAEFDIFFGRGISWAGCLLDVAVDQGLVNRSGAWYTFGDDRLGQGRENVRAYLEENPEVAGRLDALIRASALIAPQPLVSPSSTAELA
ncbi:MAG: recombinase RecA [Proteobacteria bacterium]|nr:recombinase RecA [Pseudomonadota bacterium]